MNKALAAALLAATVLLPVQSASANACQTAISEVAAKQNGLLFVRGSGLPSGGLSVCALNATTGVWCGAMARLLQVALMSGRPVVFELAGTGTCGAPTTVDTVRLK